ncbi:MAG: dihydrolipoyl dehydrogenase family protein [Sporichthyaceae bacterium]
MLPKPTAAPAVWDLLVVGGGTAGLVAAKTAARLGARVVLVERARTGGDCLWTGCVPSKALLAAAGIAAAARRGPPLGIHLGEPSVDFAAVRAHVRVAIAAIEPADSPDSLRVEGVVVLAGHARFTGPGKAVVEIADAAPLQLTFRQAVLATGASPTLSAITGLADLDPLTSDTVWDLAELPARLAVLGGGGVGCELGQAFARLGASITLIEAAGRILPREDPEASAAVHRALVTDGVDVRTGQQAVAARPDAAGGGVLRLADGTQIAFDRLLVALGRTPRTGDLGLAAAGVEVDRLGAVIVDERLRTTNPRIWAAGDLTGHPQFTHLAGAHASLAASNAVLGLRRRVNSRSVPRVTYTDPEVAAVGAATGHRTVRLVHREVDRAVTEGAPDGYTVLVLDRRGRIVGANVVGPRAGETLGELCLAVQRRLRPRDLAAVVHAYPTWNDGPWKAALAEVRASLEREPAATAVSLAVRARRRWIDRSAPGRRR